VGFYYRTDQIGKVGELYEEVLEKHPNVVAQEPESFYFVYHEYLMQMNNLKKAYELFQKASKDIGNSDVIKFMDVEIKIRLLDFTGVAENAIQIFEKYNEYGESIFSYYAAVAYMHYLELDKARQYLEIYIANGHVDQRSLELVNRVESRLDIIQSRKKTNPTGKTHPISVHAYYAFKNSKSIQMPRDQQVIIDAPSLYIIFKEGLVDSLGYFEKIILTFTTVDQLQRDYCDTGDEILQKIIQYLGENEKIKIVSPSIESILKRGNRALEKFRDYYDSLNLATEIDVLFISSYHLPLNQVNDRPTYLPLCFKVIKIVNGEIQVHCDPRSN
jgi:tetratricopeptide (TPR) repeat protein